MPIPLAAIATALSIAQSAKGLFGHHGGSDGGNNSHVDFLTQNPAELLAMLRQQSQASYGGATNKLRETLSSFGMLNSGAFPQGLTDIAVNQGQDIASQIASLYLTDFQQKKEFEMKSYFEDQAAKRDSHKQTLDLLLQAGLGAGKIISQKTGKKNTDGGDDDTYDEDEGDYTTISGQKVRNRQKGAL